MEDSELNDENVGWPSYVDFLSSFVFVLIMFVAWTVHLTDSVERERALHAKLQRWQSELRRMGYEAVIEGTKVRVPLTKQVVFCIGETDLHDEGKHSLREAGRFLASHPDVRWITVQGHADKLRGKDDFKNWKLSVNRAESVLEYLYNCKKEECHYNPEDIRNKLILKGSGDLESRALHAGQLSVEEMRQCPEEVSRKQSSIGVADDRRVDLFLESGESGHN